MAAAFKSIAFELAPELIVDLKAIVESYDNLATLRTDDPERHRLKLYFAEEAEHDVERLLAALAQLMPIRRVGVR
jgi:hypothetical protein